MGAAGGERSELHCLQITCIATIAISYLQMTKRIEVKGKTIELEIVSYKIITLIIILIGVLLIFLA